MNNLRWNRRLVSPHTYQLWKSWIWCLCDTAIDDN